MAFLTSSGLQVQGEGDGRQADGLASVAARPVPVQHVQVSVGGAHQQVLLEGLQTGGGEGRRSRDAENEHKVKGKVAQAAAEPDNKRQQCWTTVGRVMEQLCGSGES